MSIYKEKISWIETAINSILTQSFKDFEFIIVDDNPADVNLTNFLKDQQRQDNRIVIVFNTENIGLTKSLNKGLEIAKGDYIARMDADDISLPDRFLFQYNYMQGHSEVDVCGSHTKSFGNIPPLLPRDFIYPIDDINIKSYMLFKDPIAHPAVMYKKIIKGKMVSYNENYIKGQDYYLWHDLALDGAVFHNIDKVLLKRRVSTGQVSSRSRDYYNNHDSAIRNELLRSRFPDITKMQIEMHNEICNRFKSSIPLKEKLEWLLFLKKELVSNRGDYAVRKIILDLFYITCLLHKDYKSLFFNKFFSKNFIFSKLFLARFVKSIFC